jgi:hypothetical protein
MITGNSIILKKRLTQLIFCSYFKISSLNSKLTWAGLRGTSDQNGNNSQYNDAWKRFKQQVDIDEANIPEGQRKYDRYTNIIDQEYNSTGINCN